MGTLAKIAPPILEPPFTAKPSVPLVSSAPELVKAYQAHSSLFVAVIDAAVSGSEPLPQNDLDNGGVAALIAVSFPQACVPERRVLRVASAPEGEFFLGRGSRLLTRRSR